MVLSFSESLGQAVKGVTCAALANADNAAKLLNKRGLNPLKLPNVAGQFRRTLCSDPTPYVPNIPPGQCETEYRVLFRWRRILSDGSLSGFSSIQRDVYGPIVQADYVDNGNPAPASIIVVARDVDGNPTTTTQGMATTYSKTQREPVSITRRDNQPDDCGSVPPSSTDVPVQGPINITYNNNEGDEITEEGTTFIFPPIVNINGELSFPVQVDVGGVTINGNLNLDGEFSIEPTINFDFGSGGGDPPVLPPEDEEEEGRRIVGCKVYVLNNSNQTTSIYPQDQNPDIIIKAGGYVQFLQQAGDRKAWSEDIPVKTAVAWIPCPAPGWAYAVAGTPAIGVSWEINPVYDRPAAQE